MVRQGQQGDSGERGPQGDHGQTGDRGPIGMRGVRGKRGRINGRALVGYLFLTLGIVAALVRGEQINDNQNETLREIICLSANNTRTSRQRSPEEKARSAQLLKDILEIIDAKPCDQEAP